MKTPLYTDSTTMELVFLQDSTCTDTTSSLSRTVFGRPEWTVVSPSTLREPCSTGSSDTQKAKEVAEMFPNLQDQITNLSANLAYVVNTISTLSEKVLRLETAISILEKDRGFWKNKWTNIELLPRKRRTALLIILGPCFGAFRLPTILHQCFWRLRQRLPREHSKKI